jgi:hypothetical protein
MREPKFSDAPCYGREFDAQSKICRVCLANQSCQRKFLKTLGASGPGGISAPNLATRKIRLLSKRTIVIPKEVVALTSGPRLGTALPPPQLSSSASEARRDAA